MSDNWSNDEAGAAVAALVHEVMAAHEAGTQTVAATELRLGDQIPDVGGGGVSRIDRTHDGVDVLIPTGRGYVTISYHAHDPVVIEERAR